MSRAAGEMAGDAVGVAQGVGDAVAKGGAVGGEVLGGHGPVSLSRRWRGCCCQPRCANAVSGSADGRGSGGGQTAATTTVMAEAVQGIGSVVADDRGMTLYSFGKDQANPSKWTCAGAYTQTWTPVIVGDSVRTSGVAKSLLGTVHRNGKKQLTLAGWPLYRYVGDAVAGQVNGQGKDKEWYAITPSGRK
jgi:predicted lipoprotein with Yx(FWY)xxD motif